MDTVTIRNEINKAQHHEADTHELAALLFRRLHNLHAAISVKPPNKPLQHLLEFVGKFINRTPNLLDTLLEASRNSPREELCEALTGTCLDYFFSPPPLLAGRSGLNGAMAKAYLCHRLVEELNDCCAVKFAVPLLPVDFTCSNLIIHQLIGEPLANLLDDLVHNTVKRLQYLTGNCCVERSVRRDESLTALCHQRALMDEDISAIFSINSCLASCTIH